MGEGKGCFVAIAIFILFIIAVAVVFGNMEVPLPSWPDIWR